MSNLKPYILDNNTRIGDGVIMQMDPETRSWMVGNQIPDGALGIIIGYTRCTTYRERNHAMYGMKPGKYEGNGACIVLWENRESGVVSASHICPVDQSVLEDRQNDHSYKQAFDTDQFLENLPETPYYEGDVLQLHEDRFRDGGLVTVVSIDYYRLNEFCNDGITPYPCYRVRSINNDSGQISVNEADVVRLVERGNFYRYYNDLPMVFKSIEDRMSFYYCLGKVKQVRNPATGKYSWTLEQIIEAIENKQIAFMMMSGGLFGSTPFPTAYVIPGMPELEELVRQKFNLEEFKEMLKQ